MHSPEKYRIRDEKIFASMEAEGNEGTFIVPNKFAVDSFFVCIVTVEDSWEHLSVTVNRKGKSIDRCASAEELAFLKKTFWGDHETIVQYYPASSGYANMNPRCLHLYNYTQLGLPVPESATVGIV